MKHKHNVKVVNKRDNEVVIEINGVFDFGSYKCFREAYKANIKDNMEYTIDFSKVEFVDSAALGILLIFREETISQYENSTIKLINMNSEIHNIFKIANFERLFEII
jgi:HptB-dependent secretion and biofilm anti anti-sigma factor